MNGLKALKGTALALSMVALAGCGQEYNPGPEEHIAGPTDKGDVFSQNPDAAPYQTVSYEVMRSILVDILEVPTGVPSYAGTACDGLTPTNGSNCPLLAPVAYLSFNQAALGGAVYTEDPSGTSVPGLMSSGGFKAWILASSSACGMAMENQTKRDELFPNGISDYDMFYQVLLGRSPSAEEIQELDMLQASFDTDAKKAASVCSVVLASLEHLAAN